MRYSTIRKNAKKCGENHNPKQLEQICGNPDQFKLGNKYINEEKQDEEGQLILLSGYHSEFDENKLL